MRNIDKRLTELRFHLLLALLMTGATRAHAETMLLIGPGKPAPVVVTGKGASPSEQFAGRELATYLENITGPPITTVDDTKVPEAAPIIAVGASALTTSFDVSALSCEQFITDIQPRRLTIVGGRRDEQPGQGARDAGTLYGVYEFLDRLGVRWYRPEPWGEHVPRRETIELTIGRATSSAPSYEFRYDAPGGLDYYWHQTTDEEKDWGAVWAVRNRLNCWDMSLNGGTHYYEGTKKKVCTEREIALEAKLGGMEHYEWNHMYRYLLPVEEYFASHPEYFALQDGQRVRSDLCLGNPELPKLFAKKLVAKAKANPELTTLSVEPDDCLGHTCQCALCRAMDLPANSRVHGEGSNRISLFSNTIAREVAKEAPWGKLMWLGYSGHTAAPTNLAQLEPNTIVMPAPIANWNDWRKSLKEMEGTTFDLPKMLREWSELKPARLMIWEYYGGYAWPGPLPMTHSVANRWREYRKLGVKGIMNEGETSWGPQGLDRYMSVGLMWNPDLDVQRELDLYYENYYGPAARPMRVYHETLFRAFDRAPQPIWSGGHGMHLLFTPALVRELGACMAEAQTLVKDQPLYERRLAGVWAGYEFARRVSEILVLKKKHGVPVTRTDRIGNLAPEVPRPEFGGAGNYLHSAEAEKAYGELIRWVRSVNTKDHVFFMIRDQSKAKLQEDVAETIYCRKGFAESIWIAYLPYDILMNSMNAQQPETDVLREFE